MDLLHQAVLSQLMARKVTSESVAIGMVRALAEEDDDPPPLATVIGTINKVLGAMGMQVESTDNAPGGEKHYAIVDTGADATVDAGANAPTVSQLATTFSQPELEMFQKIVRRRPTASRNCCQPVPPGQLIGGCVAR